MQREHNNFINSSKISGLFDFPLKKPCIAELDKLSFLATRLYTFKQEMKKWSRRVSNPACNQFISR